MSGKALTLGLVILAVLVAVLAAIVLLAGPTGMTIGGFAMAGLTALLGFGLRFAGSRDKAIERLLAVDGPPTPVGSAPKGVEAFFRGKLVSADDHEAPFSLEPVAYWLAKATRIRRAPRKEFVLDNNQWPRAIEIDDGSGVASISMRNVSVRTSHTFGPTSWYWRNTDEDRRLEAIFGKLYPDLEVYKGASGHFSMSEKHLKAGDEVTVLGMASQVDYSDRPRVDIVNPDGGRLVVSNYDDQQVANLMGFTRFASRFSIPVLLLMVVFGAVGLWGLLQG